MLPIWSLCRTTGGRRGKEGGREGRWEGGRNKVVMNRGKEGNTYTRYMYTPRPMEERKGGGREREGGQEGGREGEREGKKERGRIKRWRDGRKGRRYVCVHVPTLATLYHSPPP